MSKKKNIDVGNLWKILDHSDVRKESEEFLDALTEPVRRRGPIFLDPTRGRKDEA